MMTPLHAQMIRELELHRKAPKTIEAYVASVAQWAQFHGRSPDKLSLEEIRSFLHHLMLTLPRPLTRWVMAHGDALDVLCVLHIARVTARPESARPILDQPASSDSGRRPGR